MILYHGSTVEVENPHSLQFLAFVKSYELEVL